MQNNRKLISGPCVVEKIECGVRLTLSYCGKGVKAGGLETGDVDGLW